MTEVASTPLPYGPSPTVVRLPHLARWKSEGRRWAMLTAYDATTAEVFAEAGIPVLLVGDSAANTVFGYTSSLRITMTEMVPLVAAVARAVTRPLVVADLPFGSYEASPELAIESATRMLRDAGAHAVKIEGGARVAATIRRLIDAGIPVMGHIGFTPQSEHLLGGYRVAGRGDAAAVALAADAKAVADAGAFAVVLEMVPAPVAAAITSDLPIPTIGIGAGPGCDAQVLVWQDMAGLAGGRPFTFVKQYADLRAVLTDATRTFAAEVSDGTFPDAAHSFDS